MLHIGLIACSGGSHASVFGMQEMFTLANMVAGEASFVVAVLAASSRRVAGFSGTTIVPDRSLQEQLGGQFPLDVVIIPPLLDGLQQCLADRASIQAVAALHAAGTRIATVCAGSFLLAATGVLDGRAATTHWHLIDEFRLRFPKVDLQPHRMLIDGGDYICGGGVSAWTDIALHIIARTTSAEIAQQCARMMLCDMPRDHQTPYGSLRPRTNHGDEDVLFVQRWLSAHYPEPLTNKRLAALAHMGVRTLQRRFLVATGEPIKRYVQRLRVEQAQARLEDANQTVASIAGAVGYEDVSAFRKVFHRFVGCSPAEYRRRFGLRGS